MLAVGNDKTLTAYKLDGKLSKIWNVSIGEVARSIDFFEGKILLGLMNGTIATLDFEDQVKEAKLSTVMVSHCEGEVWGMDVV